LDEQPEAVEVGELEVAPRASSRTRARK